ncbi:MAG TPA: ABC transporter substrate-binding protein [Methanotrichaceae archaeon]|nr:ABC transporter substrate-binding protein [Methanotrichaceae archaeon]
MRREIIIAMLALFLLSLGYPVLAQDKVLRIGYQPSTHQIAEMVAMDKGWWQDDLKPFGITEVKEFQFASGPPEMQAMLAGDLDVAYVGTAPPITAISQGLDAKIVAAVNTQGSNLVLRPDLKYDGPKSLIGLSIGTFPPGSIQDIVFKKWLKDNGIDSSKVKMLPMGQGDAITAISAGKIDGVFLPHPAPAVVEREGKGKNAVASGEMWPGHACCSLLVSGKLIKENPDLVKQIVKTHIKATNYINEHPDEAAQIFANKTGQNLDDVKYSIQTWDGKWIADPKIEIPSTTEYASIDYDLNYTSKKLTEKDLFDTSFYDGVA